MPPRQEELTRKFLKGKSSQKLRQWCHHYGVDKYDAPREELIERLRKYRAINFPEVGGCERSQSIL